MVDTVYCNKDSVKERLLIIPTDVSFDTALNSAIEEASRLVDVFMKPYVSTLPLEGDDLRDQIVHITADFASSIFKRRMTPQEVKLRGTLQPDMINDIDGTGWFALGLRKIEQYIKSFYTLAEEIGITVHNPDIYLRLFEKGIITGKEARHLINDASGSVLATIEAKVLTEEVTKTITETVDKTLIENQTISKEEIKNIKYPTKKQRSFAFVSSDKNSGYKKDAEVN